MIETSNGDAIELYSIRDTVTLNILSETGMLILTKEQAIELACQLLITARGV